MNSEFASCQSVVKVKWLVVLCYRSHVLSVCVSGSAQGWHIAEKTTVPGRTGGKEHACQCSRPKKCRFDPWVRKSPGGGHGNALQYSCLENPMDRGA